MEATMKSALIRVFQYCVVGLAVLYAVDWAVIAVRMKRHTAYGSVTVNQFLKTPLKGQKEEYDFLGSTDQQCVKSIFSHGGDLPCWWLERHTKQWQ
jgi:hypothetical protein